jgi:hypothetical protein
MLDMPDTLASRKRRIVRYVLSTPSSGTFDDGRAAPEVFSP